MRGYLTLVMLDKIRKLDRKAWERKFDKAIKVVSNIADVAVHLKSPTPLGLALIGARTYQTYKEVFTPSRGEKYKNWVKVHNSKCKATLKSFIHDSFQEFEGIQLEITYLDIPILVEKESRTPPHYHFYVSSDTENKALEAAILRSFWKDQGNFLDLTVFKFFVSTQVTLITQKLEDRSYYPSKTSSRILKILAENKQEKSCRAILLHGKPGSGKTEILKAVALESSLRTTRFSADVAPLVGYYIERDKPEVIIIDDLDHGEVENQVHLIDKLRSLCKIILVSANDFTKLNPALLRYGRFDDLIEVKTLDQDVLDKIFSGIPLELCKRLENLPASYLSEFQRQKKLRSVEELGQIADEIIAREKLVHDLSEAQKGVNLDS